MQQSPGFFSEHFPDHVCQLKKALYGLKQAPSAWFTKFSSALLSWVLVYVDDILVTGSSEARVSQSIACLHKGLLLTTSDSFQIQAYTDADWASSLDDRRSASAFCVYLGNNLIPSSSTKQKVVSRSTAESEYRALAIATAEVIWTRSLLKKLCIPQEDLPIL
ncbi:hypothetical protein UlMin_026248 [Ulmus minor]